MKEYRIHPAIGAARVGNASRGAAEGDGWFIGPETPGLPANYDPAAGVFRAFKKDGAVKAQVARFRVWEYEEQNGQLVPVREVNLDTPDIVRIEWTVELANRKAAFFKFDGQTGATDLFASLPTSALRNATVPLAQREAMLAITPDSQRIAGRDGTPQEFRNTKAHIPVPTLGEIRTDDAGRLLVMGGYGHSAFSAAISGGKEGMDHYANNNGWFDDISDGPVTARVTVRLANGTEQTFDTAHGAWVLVGPPDFAPPIGNVVTLYDALWDVAVRAPAFNLPANNALYREYAPGRGLAALRAMREAWQSPQGIATYQPSFTRGVFPIFHRGFQMHWVHQPLNVAHGNGTLRHARISPAEWATLAQLPGSPQRRQGIFRWMRDPDAANPTVPEWLDKMPRAWGDTYTDNPGNAPHLTLTRVQFAIISQWRAGRFVSDWQGEPPIPAAPDISPEGLDRAALESCVGGAFYPGIEASWLIRQPGVFVEPFRIAHGKVISNNPAVGEIKVRSGFFSQQMALPWQADFADCARDGDVDDQGNPVEVKFAWWPGQRPDEVFLDNGSPAMVEWARDIVSADVPGATDYQKWHRAMVMKWSTRGFVVRGAGGYVEREGP